MPGPDELQLQQQKQTYTQEQIREQLTLQQNWDLADGQTLEQRRHQQRERLLTEFDQNQAILRAAHQQLPQVNADAVAPGQPIQEQAPAQKTWKERRQEAKETKLANKQREGADYQSYRMVQSLHRFAQGRENSMEDGIRARAQEQGVDSKVIRSFCLGYQKGKNGQPATPVDARKKELDARFAEDYISKDVERRRPHLDRIVDQLLSEEITAETFSQESVNKNAVKLKYLGDRITYFQNMWADPINQPYFESIGQYRRDLIEARILSISAPATTMLVNRAATKGVDLDHHCFIENQEVLVSGRREDAARMQIEMLDPILAQSLAQRDAAEQQAAEREAERLIAESTTRLTADNQTMRDAIEAGQYADMAHLRGLGTTAYATLYTYEELAKYRQMIEANPENYARNKEQLDSVYKELHHAFDSMGDLTLRVAATQAQIDERNETGVARQGYSAKLLMGTLLGKQEDAGSQIESIQKHMQSMMDAIRHLSRGTDLSPGGRTYLRGRGVALPDEGDGQ